MSAFTGYNLNIPNLWQREWQSAIQDAEEPTRGVITIQAKAAALLRTIDDIEATPDRIAWLAMWTRTFSFLEGILAANSWSSSTIMLVLDRMSFECQLHVEAVIEPITRMLTADSNDRRVVRSAKIEQRAWDQVRQRLYAYTAWCVWNDRAYYRDMLDNRSLAAIWDPAPRLRLLSLEREHPGIDKLFLPTEIDIEPSRLKAGKSKMRNALQTHIARCETWLDDPRLRSWAKKLYEPEAHARPTSFLGLLMEGNPSVAKRLSDVNRRFSYAQYMAGSMVIHGSSLEKILAISNGIVFPAFVAPDRECNDLVLQVRGKCEMIVLLLAMAKGIRSRLRTNRTRQNSRSIA